MIKGLDEMSLPGRCSEEECSRQRGQKVQGPEAVMSLTCLRKARRPLGLKEMKPGERDRRRLGGGGEHVNNLVANSKALWVSFRV